MPVSSTPRLLDSITKVSGYWVAKPGDDDRMCGNDADPCLRDLAACFARGLPSMSRPLQSEGAGNAGRPMRPIAACAGIVVERTRVSQVTPESPGIPRAMVYGLLRALPGDRALLPPSSLRSLLPKNLTPASGRQDHTTSPSASALFVQQRLRVHRIPPRVDDVGQRPSCGTGRGNQCL